MIDLIIPAYNAHKTIGKTLISICLQTCKDYLNVIIVNDASDNDYSSFVEKFSKKIKISQISNSVNSGPAVSRQVGIDNSNNEYIMFLDADDLLYDCFAISNLKKIIDTKEFDFLSGCALFEQKDKIIKYKDHFGCLHGKVFRREFLKRNDIKFNNYRIHEDNAFCQLVLMAQPKIEYCNDLIYLYKDNKNSITRKEQLEYDRAFEFIDNMKWVLNEAEKHQYNKKLISEFLSVALGYIYYIYCVYEKQKNVSDLITEIIPLYKKDKEYYDIGAESLRLKVQAFYTKNNYSISFYQFLNIIESEIKKTEDN